MFQCVYISRQHRRGVYSNRYMPGAIRIKESTATHVRQRNTSRQHYAAHVATQQQPGSRRWTRKASIRQWSMPARQLVSFLDDYHYPFRPNPHFLAWLPLTQPRESVLIVRPGRQAGAVLLPAQDYWYLPPSDPEPWWAEHFDVRPMRRAGRAGARACRWAARRTSAMRRISSARIDLNPR